MADKDAAADAPVEETPAAKTPAKDAPSPAAPAPETAAASSPPKPASAAASAAASPPPAAAEPAAAVQHAPHDSDALIDPEIDDDGDSAVGDATSTYTTSLASSTVNYPVEHGRRYHAYQSGRYTRPNDEQEMDRLLILHSVVTLAMGALQLAPVDFEEPQRILDIGTGNGVWAIEMADLYPNATIIGNDLSANMPTFVPPNVKFEVDDVESEWVYEVPFTYIFCRYMAVSIGDWQQLVNRSFENLAPGGWAEFQDFDLQFYSEDGSLAPDNSLLVWDNTMLDAGRQIGRDPCPGPKLKGWLEKAGFTNIVHRRYKLPIGPWARDPNLKKIGLHNFMQVNQGLEALSMRLYINVLGWTEEQAIVALADVRKQLRNPNVHTIYDFHVVYGQKPE